jgi:hypothetical protein
MDGVCEFPLGYVHRDKKLFQEHFAGMSRCTIGWNTNHFVLLMIVYDLDLVGTLLRPKKADAVLVIDADAVLNLGYTIIRNIYYCNHTFWTAPPGQGLLERPKLPVSLSMQSRNVPSSAK